MDYITIHCPCVLERAKLLAFLPWWTYRENISFLFFHYETFTYITHCKVFSLHMCSIFLQIFSLFWVGSESVEITIYIVHLSCGCTICLNDTFSKIIMINLWCIYNRDVDVFRPTFVSASVPKLCFFNFISWLYMI